MLGGVCQCASAPGRELAAVVELLDISLHEVISQLGEVAVVAKAARGHECGELRRDAVEALGHALALAADPKQERRNKVARRSHRCPNPGECLSQCDDLGVLVGRVVANPARGQAIGHVPLGVVIDEWPLPRLQPHLEIAQAA